MENFDTEQHQGEGTGKDRATALATEYIQRKVAGEDADIEWYLTRLESDLERTRFQELVAGADIVDGLLPRQVRAGLVLSERYRIDRELGAGGMGKVFEATDLKLKRRVAVKVLGALDSEGIDVGDLFERECQLLASLQHPGIVSIHEAGQDGDVQYFVMDRVDGVAVADVIDRVRSGPVGVANQPTTGDALARAINLPAPDGGRNLIEVDSWVRTVVGVMTEVARTIEAAHGQGVVHRDIKPGNVMLKGDGMPVVLDFGLAGRQGREAGELTRRLFGSACYLAPEQARSGESGSDPRTDVYQLGLLLYEMLTLRRAFPGDDLSTVLCDIGAGSFDKPRKHNRDIPRALEAICLKAMELRPERRYQTARELRDDLEIFLSGLGPPRAARGGSSMYMLRDSRYFVRRHKVVAMVAAALVVGVLGSFAFFAAHSGPAAPEVSLFAYDDSGQDARIRLDPSSARSGEVIGVRLIVEEPAWVYAFALAGTDSSRDFWEYRPVREIYRGRGQDEFGLLQRPTDEPMLAYVDTAESGAQPHELGLAVFVLKERDELLERYMKELDGRGTVTLRDAVKIFRGLSVHQRGKAMPDGPSPEEWADRVRRMRDAEVVRAMRLPFCDLEPFYDDLTVTY